MPTIGTKQLQKIANLSRGKVILKDTVLTLQDTLKAVKTGDSRDLKKLLARISLLLQGLSLVNDLLDDALRLDGSSKVAQELMSADTAQGKRDQIRNNRLGQSSIKNTRKPPHELRLQTAIRTPTKAKAKANSITINPLSSSRPKKKVRRS